MQIESKKMVITDYMRKIGQKGGKATLAKHGKDHFGKIGSKKRKKKKKTVDK